VTVLLDGQGGDELFAGYDGYRPALVADYLRRLRLGAAIREARAAGRAGGLAARTAVLLAPEAVRRRARERARVGTASFVAPSLGERRSALAEVERGSSLADLLRRALLSTVLPVLLRSEDRSSMAHSREARVPFLDHRLVELAFSLPTRLKVADGVTKRVFRDAVADLVPELVLERRDKVGFVTPEAEWLKRLPADTRAVSGDLVRREAVDELWRRLDAGDAGVAQRLWRVTCFERWRRVLGATLP
jgi:asparagine synthase (glutamine-hydrolysing)